MLRNISVVGIKGCFLYLLQIRQDLQNNGIDIYPQKEFDEDAEDRLVNEKIRVSIQSYYPLYCLDGCITLYR